MAISSLNGVSLSDIAEVNGVPIANIAKINGEDVVLLQVPSSPTDLTLTPVTGPAVLVEDNFDAGSATLDGRIPSANGGTGDSAWADPNNAGVVDSASGYVGFAGATISYTRIDSIQTSCVIETEYLTSPTSSSIGLSLRRASTAGSGRDVLEVDWRDGLLRIVDQGSVVRSESVATAVGVLRVELNGPNCSATLNEGSVSYDQCVENGLATHGLYGQNGVRFNYFKVTELP